MAFKFKMSDDRKELKRIQREFKKLNKTEIDFGWIGNQKYPTKDGSIDRRGMSVAQVAQRNEFGSYAVNNDGKTIYIPERPYFRQAVNNTHKFIKFNIEMILEAVLKGDKYNDILKYTGQDLVDNVKSSVAKQNYKKLHEKTINIKGNSTQWINTGRLLDSIQYKVTYKRADYGKKK